MENIQQENYLNKWNINLYFFKNWNLNLKIIASTVFCSWIFYNFYQFLGIFKNNTIMIGNIILNLIWLFIVSKRYTFDYLKKYFTVKTVDFHYSVKKYKILIQTKKQLKIGFHKGKS